MKKLLAMLLMSTMALMAMAQPGADAQEKKKIADIKKDAAYIYAEVTTTSAEEAVKLAHELLLNNINNWMKTQKKFSNSKQAVILNKGKHTEEIVLRRANMHRAFVYVKTADIVPSENATIINANEEDQPVISKDDVDMDSVAVVDSTEVDSVTVDSTTVDSVAEEDVQPDVPVVIPEPVPEPKPKPEPEPKPVPPVLDDSNYGITVRRMLESENTGQLQAKLRSLKAEGKITEFCKLSDLKNKNAAEYVMVIFTREGRIEAVLGTGENRQNMRTGAEDAISNYKGCGAIGVKVAQ